MPKVHKFIITKKRIKINTLNKLIHKAELSAKEKKTTNFKHKDIFGK
tara:strand:+ start:1798 stop:1938 length:141 start_codon:yes stop_codon:yes gene_type:complete